MASAPVGGVAARKGVPPAGGLGVGAPPGIIFFPEGVIGDFARSGVPWPPGGTGDLPNGAGDFLPADGVGETPPDDGAATGETPGGGPFLKNFGPPGDGDLAPTGDAALGDAVPGIGDFAPTTPGGGIFLIGTFAPIGLPPGAPGGGPFCIPCGPAGFGAPPAPGIGDFFGPTACPAGGIGDVDMYYPRLFGVCKTDFFSKESVGIHSVRFHAPCYVVQ